MFFYKLIVLRTNFTRDIKLYNNPSLTTQTLSKLILKKVSSLKTE